MLKDHSGVVCVFTFFGATPLSIDSWNIFVSVGKISFAYSSSKNHGGGGRILSGQANALSGFNADSWVATLK